MGSDLVARLRAERKIIFQSTLPAWGATNNHQTEGYEKPISIHAPRMGSDAKTMSGTGFNILFQSTLPAWGATANNGGGTSRTHISIHAPRMGSDASFASERVFNSYFNPRSPHGERPERLPKPFQKQLFQSTLPAWGATVQSKHTAMTA